MTKKKIVILMIGLTIVIAAGLLAGLCAVTHPENRLAGAILSFKSDDMPDYPSYQFDAVRNLVNAHSRYDDQAPQRERDILLQDVYDFITGEKAQAPAMNSAERAALFAVLLRAAGFKAREVILFPPDADQPPLHMVEAFNKKSRRWELQDQDRNVFYKSANSNRRLDVRAILTDGVFAAEPCTMDGYCNWETASPDGLSAAGLKSYFAAVLTGGDLMVSRAHFDLENTGLCVRYPEACRGKTVFYD
ncbi:MAG: transglutaminase domain-containing protein [Rhodospirillales bacterium]|nr:transglutaminase domain-containing protein [Rhodospirillales bacterium]MCB9997247.1 transglutaminase domain-containing protein [Rhodospirillales bacterium]